MFRKFLCDSEKFKKISISGSFWVTKVGYKDRIRRLSLFQIGTYQARGIVSAGVFTVHDPFDEGVTNGAVSFENR